MSVPALVGRNPFPLLALLIVVLVVRSAWALALARDAGWVLILRVALVVSLISVLFNVLTAPFGDQVIATLPGWWPLGDVVTANALVYGLLSAIAVVVILLAGTTAGLLADWPELLRSVPTRFLPLAVAGSVAWAFVPQTVATIRDIRDAQHVRGIRLTSARSLLPLLVPLLATSLERATTMAEALEARGFGGAAASATGTAGSRGPRSLAAALGLTLAVAAVYLWLDGSPTVAVPAAIVATGFLAVALAVGGRDGRTRYRARVWRRRDSVVLAAAAGSLAVTGSTLIRDAAALRYSPYPDIGVPVVDLALILAIGLLLAPAVVAPLVPLRRMSDLDGSMERGDRPVVQDFPKRAARRSAIDPEHCYRPAGRWPPRRPGGASPRPYRRRPRRPSEASPRPDGRWSPGGASGSARSPERLAGIREARGRPCVSRRSAPFLSPVPLGPGGARRLRGVHQASRPWATWPVRRRTGVVPGRRRSRLVGV